MNRMQRTWEASQDVWIPIDLELVRDGYLARVTRTMTPGRWRWVVAPLDHIVKWNRGIAEIPYSKGFSKSCESAISMAEAAIEALKKAKAE